MIQNETCSDWDSLIPILKEEFIKYPIEVGWNLQDRRPSNASQGNVLEAINVTLNLMQFHFLDRDLHRTGNSIVVVTAGCGVFEVDKGLAGITYQRVSRESAEGNLLLCRCLTDFFAPVPRLPKDVSKKLIGEWRIELHSPLLHLAQDGQRNWIGRAVAQLASAPYCAIFSI